MMNEVIEAVATHDNLGFLKDSGILTEKSSQEEN